MDWSSVVCSSVLVGVEHGHHGQDAIGFGDAQPTSRHGPEGVQEGRAVRVHHALGVPGGAGRVAHARRTSFVPDVERHGVGGGQQVLVVVDAGAVGAVVAGDLVGRTVVHDHQVLQIGRAHV